MEPRSSKSTPPHRSRRNRRHTLVGMWPDCEDDPERARRDAFLQILDKYTNLGIYLVRCQARQLIRRRRGS